MRSTKDITLYNASGEIVTHFTQWDHDQKLYIRDASIPSGVEFHFANIRCKTALVVKASEEENGLSVDVPDLLLQDSYPIIIHLHKKTTAGPASTIYTIRIPVYPKPKPGDYPYSDRYTVVQKVEGRFQTDTFGSSGADVGFKPDMIIIQGEKYAQGDSYVTCDLQVAYLDEETIKRTSTYSPSGDADGYPIINAIIERNSTGFLVTRLWSSNYSGREAVYSGKTYNYIAIKYT